MNQWKRCLQCWIPVSKKNDKKSVINAGADTETDDLDRMSSHSFDPLPQALPIPYRRSSTVATPTYVEDTHFWNPPPPQYPGNYEGREGVGGGGGDTSENYIPLDECLSGVSRGATSRQQPPRSFPRLVSRDIHLLDRVPPSPCSLTDNPASLQLSGMPEVYAPMSRSLVGPPSLSPRLASRGCCTDGGGPRRNPPTPISAAQSARRDPHGTSVLGAFESAPSPRHYRTDPRNNNNNCFNFKPDHGRGVVTTTRSDPRARGGPYSSVSSDTSSSSPCCPSRFPHSETLPYRNNVAVNGGGGSRPCVVNQQSLPLTVSERREISDRYKGATTLNYSPGEALPSRGGDTVIVLCGGGDGPISGHSLDSKMLNMTPPAPLPNAKLKAHKYVNANENGSSIHRTPPEGQDSSHNPPTAEGCPDDADPPTTTGGQSVTGDSDGYYNLLPTTNGQSMKSESAAAAEEQLTPPPPLPPPCHGPSRSRKKQFQQRQHIRPDSPNRRSPLSVALPQRARREWHRTTTEESSSSNDDDGSSSGFSAHNSNTSLNRPGDASSLRKSFTTKPPAPSSQQPRIEYLQLDLDQPSVATTKASPGPVHRAQNSTIDYIEIDPCRTKALSDTKRQLESNRHKTISH